MPAVVAAGPAIKLVLARPSARLLVSSPSLESARQQGNTQMYLELRVMGGNQGTARDAKRSVWPTAILLVLAAAAAAMVVVVVVVVAMVVVQ